MKAVIWDIEEISESREVLESQKNQVIPYVIYSFLFVIVGLLAWSYFGEIDVVVKTTGVIRPNEAVSTITSKSISKVTEIHYKQGDVVHRGEVLLVLEHDDLLVEKRNLEAQIERVRREKMALEAFRKSVNEGRNHFGDVNDPLVFQYMQYLYDRDKWRAELEQSVADLKKARLSALKTETDSQLALQKLFDDVKRNEQEIDALKTLEQSILRGENGFTPEDVPYYNQYIDFDLELRDLRRVANQKEAEFKRLEALGETYVPRVEIERAKEEWKAAEQAVDAYINKTLFNIREKIKQTNNTLQAGRKDIQRLEQEARQAKDIRQLLDNQIAQAQNYMTIVLDKMKNDKIVELNTKLKTIDEHLKDLQDRLDSVEVAIRERIIRAPIDGVINVISDLNVGDTVMTGQEILRILPKQNADFKVMLSVPNKDISAMKVGRPIKYHVLALPFTEYGELRGKIEKVSMDVNVDPKNAASFYIVEASIENRPLYNGRGEMKELKAGMAVEAYVVTDRKRILNYVLEKLNLWR